MISAEARGHTAGARDGADHKEASMEVCAKVLSEGWLWVHLQMGWPGPCSALKLA